MNLSCCRSLVRLDTNAKTGEGSCTQHFVTESKAIGGFGSSDAGGVKKGQVCHVSLGGVGRDGGDPPQ